VTITIDEFIQKYNKVYNTNIRCLFTNTHEIYSIMEKLYDACDFDIDEENETIELF
jgi:hypothetical protein